MQVSPNISHLTPDASVMAIAWVEGHPISVPCQVHSQAPLFLKTGDPFIQFQTFPLFGTMLWDEDGRVVRADAEFTHLEQAEAGSIIKVSGVRSEPLDRRRHPRVAVDSSVSIRLVDDSEGHPAFTLVQGRVLDLSMSGALIQVSPVLDEGTLLEFNAKSVHGELIRTLGVVIKAREDSIGIAFIEPRASTQGGIERWIERAA